MNEPRQIITLNVLKEILKDIPEIIFTEIITAYSLPYDEAILRFEVRFAQVALFDKAPKIGNFWLGLKTALNNMTPIERDRLREQCKIEVSEKGSS